MTTENPKSNQVTGDGPVSLRIILCGSPESGKTATANALGEGLGQAVTAYGTEVPGGAGQLEWMEYVGGRHQGQPIRTQLMTMSVAVPAPARQQALAAAHVVLFVADTSTAGIDRSLDGFREIEHALAQLSEPQPSVVFQANKRDCDDAPSLDEVKSRFDLDDGRIVIETVAVTGSGVRQAFVYAVRVGLEHLIELERAGNDTNVGAIDPEEFLVLIGAASQGDGSDVNRVVEAEEVDGSEPTAEAVAAVSDETESTIEPAEQAGETAETAETAETEPTIEPAEQAGETAETAETEPTIEPAEQIPAPDEPNEAPADRAEPTADEAEVGDGFRIVEHTDDGPDEAAAVAAEKPRKRRAADANRSPNRKSPAARASRPPGAPAPTQRAKSRRRDDPKESSRSASAPPPPGPDSVRSDHQPPPPPPAAGEDDDATILNKVKQLIRGD